MMEEHSQEEDHDLDESDQDVDDSKEDMAAGTGVFVTEIGPKDVLLGRGTGPANHQGNVTFRLRVESMKPNYVATASRRSKNKLVRELVDSITAEKGRFLRKLSKAQARRAGFPDDGESRYEVVPDFVAVGKTKQAIRYVHYKKEPNERANQEDNDDEDRRWANKRRQGVDSEALLSEDAITRRKRALSSSSGVLSATGSISSMHASEQGNLSRDATYPATAQHHQLQTGNVAQSELRQHASAIAAYQAAIAHRVPRSHMSGGGMLGQLPPASNVDLHTATLLQQQIQQRQFGVPSGPPNLVQHEQIARLLAFGGFPLVPAAQASTQQNSAFMNQFITNRLTGVSTAESTLSSSPSALRARQEELVQGVRAALPAGGGVTGSQQASKSVSIRSKHTTPLDAASNPTNPRGIPPPAVPTNSSQSSQQVPLPQPPAAGPTSAVLLNQYNERLRAIAEADTHYQSLLRAYLTGAQQPKEDS